MAAVPGEEDRIFLFTENNLGIFGNLSLIFS